MGNSEAMKYGLKSSNFKVGYESFKNPFHPFVAQPHSRLVSSKEAADKHAYLNSLQSIFDVALIIERNTKNILKENKKLTPVAIAQVGNGHACHAMVLDCILADIEKDDQGNTVLDSNGDPKLKNC